MKKFCPMCKQSRDIDMNGHCLTCGSLVTTKNEVNEVVISRLREDIEMTFATKIIFDEKLSDGMTCLEAHQMAKNLTYLFIDFYTKKITAQELIDKINKNPELVCYKVNGKQVLYWFTGEPGMMNKGKTIAIYYKNM